MRIERHGNGWSLQIASGMCELDIENEPGANWEYAAFTRVDNFPGLCAINFLGLIMMHPRKAHRIARCVIEALAALDEVLHRERALDNSHSPA